MDTRQGEKMRVIGYTRVSTEGQADSGLGLEAQRNTIEAATTVRGWNLDLIATDAGLSGKSLKGRRALADALDALDRGEADVLMASKLDRLSRSSLDFAAIMERAQRGGWKLIVLDVDVDTSTPSGELMAGMMALMAQHERRIIGQRTKDALAVKRAAGVTLGRPVTLSAEIRAEVVAMREAGLSFAKIAAELNAREVPTAHGGSQWWPSTVRKIAA
ncbi:MAG: recombinase family protein [Actinomycetota bacterium]